MDSYEQMYIYHEHCSLFFVELHISVCHLYYRNKIVMYSALHNSMTKVCSVLFKCENKLKTG